jgi:DNA-binding SARP family transcriptional activator
MPLDGAIDLHANHSVVMFRNEQDQVIDHYRFTNDLPEILASPLEIAPAPTCAPLPRERVRSSAHLARCGAFRRSSPF